MKKLNDMEFAALAKQARDALNLINAKLDCAYQAHLDKLVHKRAA